MSVTLLRFKIKMRSSLGIISDFRFSARAYQKLVAEDGKYSDRIEVTFIKKSVQIEERGWKIYEEKNDWRLEREITKRQRRSPF